jgi:hypothetical protein
MQDHANVSPIPSHLSPWWRHALPRILRRPLRCLVATVKQAAESSNRLPRVPKANLNMYRLAEIP